MTAANFLIVFNLFILESMLSIDNAAVLSLMVKDLPFHQKPKALRYGMLGAFAFRGLFLLCASWLIKILWLKIVGGAYLLYLVYGHFSHAKDTIEEGIDKDKTKWYLKIKQAIGPFWSTVILVEIMDLAFSIDNIFAAVAMTDNLFLIVVGVCLGIITMRFIATKFIKLMEKHPSLETSAMIVILLLGFKLMTGGALEYLLPRSGALHIMESHAFDLSFSGVMMLIFFIPLLIKKK